MDFLTADVGALYRKYLFASLGSAMVMSIYSFVDTIAVGQAVGPMGTAAIAVLNPFFSIMIFLAILCGIGGAVLMSNAKGEGLEARGNAYFTAALVLVGVVIVVGWPLFYIFHEQIFVFLAPMRRICLMCWRMANGWCCFIRCSCCQRFLEPFCATTVRLDWRRWAW